MKKLYILTALLGSILYSCDPTDNLQDIANEEIDNSLTEGEANYTLTEDDYEEVGFNIESGFDNYEQAEELIPVVLDNAFPLYQNGTSIITTFNVEDPLLPVEYTVSEDDYTAIGNQNGYFSSTSQVQSFLESQFEAAQNGDLVELTYNTVANEIAYELSSEDFDLLEEELGETYPNAASSAANYSNFDRRETNDAYWSNDMILEAINVILNDAFDGVEGQRYNVSYDIYDGSAGTESMTVEFNGNSYVPVGGASYELDNADYALARTELADTYPGPANNLSYNSFNIDEGSSNYWSEEMIVEALNIILGENFTDVTEGSQFEVSYTIYNGSNTAPESLSLIFEDGEFVINNEPTPISTIETTVMYAYTGSSWNMPLSLSTEDYAEMGQSYPNFDDESEAFYNIGIYLDNLYTYPPNGSSAVVSYQFYDGSTNTRYSLFTLQDGEWIGVPRVIETTLQFAKTDGIWVPDNTISYFLTGSDYSTVAEALVDQYPDPVSSMARYSNFDRRNGNAAYWSDDMIIEAMRIVLNSIDPDAEVGQQYDITYDVYNGSNVTETISLIKNEAGEWVINE
ncbi:hypothetical protein SAMN04487907_101667 [Zunongwangia mangrovi]|uniref:DUF5017 domain-containing protein n=1 Tax=Zunongwangia mangrovi TaxID=1334022 RepID=A0A1I1DWV2_9FLAO|nr:hypothetical protein SAMN04487907_101667 [Zunongwangia mangrovi]